MILILTLISCSDEQNMTKPKLLSVLVLVIGIGIGIGAIALMDLFLYLNILIFILYFTKFVIKKGPFTTELPFFETLVKTATDENKDSRTRLRNSRCLKLMAVGGGLITTTQG